MAKLPKDDSRLGQTQTLTIQPQATLSKTRSSKVQKGLTEGGQEAQKVKRVLKLFRFA